MNPRIHAGTLALALAAFAVLGAPAAQAALSTYQGNLASDDELFVLNFQLHEHSTIDARTLSWASGGFAGVLSLFGPGGLLQQAVGSSNACAGASGVPDPATGFCWDAYFSVQLGAGDYTLVLSQDGNLPIGGTLADGFSMSGQPNYTGTWFLGDASRSFINVDGSQRSSDWAFTLEGHAVPEPAAWSLAAAALLALGATRRSRRS
ncbi:DVUA0089 family protein [Aquabacterium sp.]|uniref:DVUA0089 family protein n=1 Tax=Aquabacterium sp. TaxID=1872578 RepID=UPI002B5B7948|nr:DVUA0089 family protein [Aquabacterium sp.]HSW05324.1 DVUA0089 family protein [Aquabacterium sp.]